MTLSPDEIAQLRDALHSAYDYSSLDQMLFFQLGKNVQDISLGSNFRQVILDLIRGSLRAGWTDKLVHAAHDANPGNQKLKAFTDQYLRYKGSKGALEKVIRKTNGFIDVAQWRTKLAKIERQVCRIEIHGDHAGTGFLIADDLVMTNYHVIEELLGDQPAVEPHAVRLRFDMKKSADGNTVNDGVRYRLPDENWNVDASPYSEADGKPDALPSADELDYAILRVAPRTNDEGNSFTPGREPVQGTPDKFRGWIPLPQKAFDFQPHLPLFIVQHPEDQPLKMALDTDSIQSVNANGTRVKYTTNTEPGSSGSPCFDSNWNIVALHHFGDTNWKNPEWNQGIPIHLIASRLKSILDEEESNEPEPEPPPKPHSEDDEVDELLG